MADVKWIKIVTDIFDDEKILLIESMPAPDSVIVIWFKLLCLAGKQNNKGVFMLNDKIPYTEEMLATIFRRPVNTVRLALNIFKQYGMIEIIDGTITIPNWEKHQSLGKLERSKEQNRKRVAEHRKKQKQLALLNDENVEKSESNEQCNDYSNVTVTECNADRIEEEKNKNRIEKSKSREDKERINYQEIVDMYNETCVSFPQVVVVSENRKKAIKARLNNYTVEQLRTMFKKAEASDFLKGKNDRNWSANFDWLMKDSNTAKVLEGNYDNKVNTQTNSTPIQQNTYNENQKYIDAVNENQRFLEEMAAREMGLNK